MSVTISKTVRKNFPVLPYDALKNEILGKGYSLSLAFVGDRTARALNREYRNKTYVPNILSFPLDTKHGEIIINPRIAHKEAPRFSMTSTGYIGFLFIHGLLHLKGLEHGATMERAEKKYVSKYHLK